MKGKDKVKEQFPDKLAALRRRVAELEKREAERRFTCFTQEGK